MAGWFYPTRYKKVCQKALKAKEDLNLSDVQTLLYNHVCRGDFSLSNDDGWRRYVDDSEGSREYVKKLYKPLVDAGLVTFESRPAPRDSRYRIWSWYDSSTIDFEDLVDGGCYATASKFYILKSYLKLPDNFKRDEEYGDIRFIKSVKYWTKDSEPSNEKTDRYRLDYSFKYKGVEHYQTFFTDYIDGKDQIRSIAYDASEDWEDGNDRYLYEDSFNRLVHRIFAHVMYYDKVDLYSEPHCGTNVKSGNLNDYL